MVCPTRLGEPEASGRRRPEPQPDKAYELEMELVIESIGQEAPADLERMLPGVDLAGGLIATLPGSARTSRPEVFAGGDLVRGASTVVAAVVDGMKAAKEIDAFLRQPSKEGR
jgi:glutamate synthase (NADPH/NADH) small chain